MNNTFSKFLSFRINQSSLPCSLPLPGEKEKIDVKDLSLVTIEFI